MTGSNAALREVDVGSKDQIFFSGLVMSQMAITNLAVETGDRAIRCSWKFSIATFQKEKITHE